MLTESATEEASKAVTNALDTLDALDGETVTLTPTQIPTKKAPTDMTGRMLTRSR